MNTMADVAFDRTNGAKADALSLPAEGIRQGGYLYRIAQFGSGAVGLDIGQFIGAEIQLIVNPQINSVCERLLGAVIPLVLPSRSWRIL